MTTREIFVRLKADASQFKKEMDDASAKTRASVDRLAVGAGLMGAAMMAGAGMAVRAFANFDQAMSNVQAATMETAGNMDLLRDAALDAGAKTAFSATEAAAGIEELAKAGVSTKDILAGGLAGALDLAAAGGISVAEASETAASALTQFGLSGSDVTHIADLLAAGSAKAQGSVSDLGAALNQSGLVANQMGISIEETVGSLTAFASAGLTGSDAGTAFRSMLLRLAAPTVAAQKAMDEFGISVYDTSGNFIGMEALAGQLQDRLGGLDQQTRNATLATIFGQDAIRTSAILYEQGAAGVAQWTDAVDQTGFAAEQAAIRMDNLKGDWEEFTGSLETALIGAGEGANGPLRALTQGATNVVNAFSDLPAAVQQSTVAIAGTGGLAMLGVAGVAKLITIVGDVNVALTALGVSAKTAGLAVGGIMGGLGLAAIAVTTFANAQAEAKQEVESLADTLDKTTGALTEYSREWFVAEATQEGWLDAAKMAGIDLGTFTEALMGNAEAIATVETAMRALSAASQPGMLPADEVWDAHEAISALGTALGWSKERIDAAKSSWADNAAAMGGATTAEDALGESTATTTGAIDAQTTSLADLMEMEREYAGIVLGVMEAESAFQAAIDEASAALVTNGQTFDLNTEQGRANQAALLDLANAGWDNVEALLAQDPSGETARAAMEQARGAFVAAAIAAGMSADEANRLANSLGLIPSNVNTLVQADATQAIAAAEAALRAINAIPTYKMFTMDGSISSAFESASRAAGNFNSIYRASGGPIYGPGTSTSDSIPARLSNGEYVVKAASVQQYGRTFFDAVNAGRFASGGYAGGGSVRTGATGAQSADLASSLRAVMENLTITITETDYFTQRAAAHLHLALLQGV